MTQEIAALTTPLRQVSVIALAMAVSRVALGGTVDFNRDVRPILSNHCFTCHGPDATTREAGLRLDDRDSATRMLDSGLSAIVAGDPDASELMVRIRASDPDQKMPPSEGGKPLSDKQIDVLKTWIEEGAEYQPHWAFVTPTAQPLPKTRDVEWPQNAVDTFVLSRLESNGLAPAPEATRETLIRRVSFDLTGLPPTLDDVDAFVRDQAPGAYGRMVDRYLKKPAYGEHMARHWLDLARYADSNGYQYDTEREQWVWRDWVINAYNRNKPFDEFTIEQLAGDLLPNATPQQRLATGFNRNHGITIEGGIIDEEYRTEYVMDRVVTTGTVWLGLTIGCARCHEHKYDPISQREFYQLYAFFNQVPERGMRGFAPKERIPSPLAVHQSQQLKAQIAELEKQLAEFGSLDPYVQEWAEGVAEADHGVWETLTPETFSSTGGTTLTRLDDQSLLAGGANPNRDVYEITVQTARSDITAVRLEALTHESLPGGGPGRHSNSNFVLSEFEVTASALNDPSVSRKVSFARAFADYSQANYEIAKAIDGTVAGNNGWAVDGPTRKQPATAVFVASESFGYEGGTELRIRLRHEAGFATHGVGRPRFSVSSDEASKLTLQGIPAEIQEIAERAPKSRSESDAQRLRQYFLKHHDPRRSLRDQIAAVQGQLAAEFPETMVMADLPQPRKTYVLNRGQYNEPTDEVSAAVPQVFPPMVEGMPQNRLGFARWLVDARHPLTARVAVNRYWQRIMGVGLVKTSEDFGLQGELPSHPGLLDWLALEFIRSGWDIKHIQRLILTSATYRQSSHVGAEAYARDPENRLLARGPRMRLDAEEIRDAALAIGGQLVSSVGGKSVYPYQPQGLWLELNNRPGYSKAYPVGTGDELYRRSMYTFWKRTVPSPMLKTFDAPEREFCTIRRSRTNTPLQALLLLNGPQFIEASRYLGRRMVRDGGESLDQQITFGFRLVTARRPTPREMEILKASYQSEYERLSRDLDAANRLLDLEASTTKLDAKAIAERLRQAAAVSIARMLFNLNEAITKG